MKKIFFALAMGVGILLTACNSSQEVRYEAQNVVNGELVRFSDGEGKTFPFDTGQVVTIEKKNEMWEIFTDAKLPNKDTDRKFAKVKILRVVDPVEKKEPNLAGVPAKEKSIFE